ncbi:PREDICTED: nucleolin 1-like isoform X2 [Priapulus caudatus]|uniref:Nucleolin 1-like isoform X2 n=1 Tax=Priapulus caudatus TaxID=37621 RepID=A0ABM1EZH6_PRICU|nr:PREDICTED: nucleolin 1-like isoform X2 [Priapulus caudatus]
MATLNVHTCIYCRLKVRASHQAVQCEICDRWQHRLCDTGINREFYRQALRGHVEMQWVCRMCAAAEQSSAASVQPQSMISRHDSSSSDDSTTDEEAELALPQPKPIIFRRDSSSSSDDSTTDEETELAQPQPKPIIFRHDSSSSSDDSTTDEETELAQPQPKPIIFRHDSSSSDDSTTNEQPEIPPPPVQYEVIDSASTRGRPKLADDRGFTYTSYRRSDVTTTWRCRVRNNHAMCLARVKQNNDRFLMPPCVGQKGLSQLRQQTSA